MNHTSEQFDKVIGLCKDIFFKKLEDYGTAWRIMRPASVTDQIFIKAQRIRSIQEKGVTKVDEGIIPEFIGIINYSIIGLMQLTIPEGTEIDMDKDTVKNLYTKWANDAKDLMERKNHDYGEAWRGMRVDSYTDLILMKIHRSKQIEDNKGKTLISEGIDANYFDMINYSVFALIKLVVEQNKV